MLKTLRENFKHLQWILWLVIAIFVVFVFVDWGMGTTRTGSESELAAKASGIRITTGEFRNEYRDTEDRYRQLYGKNFTPELAKAMNLPEQVMNTLIDRRLMRQEADRLRLTVTDEEVSQKILSLKDGQGRLLFVKDGVFVGEAQYRRMLAGAGMAPESFEARTREQMLLEKLNRYLTESTFVSDEEVRDDHAGRTEKAKISYVLLPAAPVPPGAVSDAEAEAYFKGNPAAYLQPEKRKGKYLLVETAKIRGSIKVSDAEVAAEYNANLETYKRGDEVHARHILYKAEGAAAEAAAKAKADAALRRLKGGADFAALARAESEDPGSKASGGDLGTFGRGRMVKEFEEAAFGAEPNALAGPVKSPFGWHVIQVLEKTAERVQPLFEVAPAIRNRLADQKAADEARRLARDLADRIAKIGKPSDDEMRRMTGPNVTFNETDFVGKGDTPAGIGANPGFTQALFSLETGEVSDPVSTARGEAVVKLVEVKKPGTPVFAEVKARVMADLVRKKQDEATVATLRKAMGEGLGVEDVAKKLNLKLETPEAFGKNGPIPGLGAAKGLLDAAFAANVDETKGPVFVADRGAVAFRLLEKTPFDKAAFEAQKERIRESLKTQKSSRLLQSLIARRRAEMKIEINKDLLSRFGSRT